MKIHGVFDFSKVTKFTDFTLGPMVESFSELRKFSANRSRKEDCILASIAVGEYKLLNTLI